jgi:hypothetical protein
MRQRYRHFLSIPKPELDQIWRDGVLTVDANVLLDLYRYHPETRAQLLHALQQFSGRLWIAHQAADEFFKNRNSVITSAYKDYDEAESLLKQALSTVERLRALRLIPKEIVVGVVEDTTQGVDKARAALKQSRDSHPDYLNDDPILETILSLFEGAVGAEPTEEQRSRMKQEAERRQSNRIPPGFRDGKKDGDKPFADYFLWAQVLDRAATGALPIILVTSEKKDDWWETHRGRRWPRRELLEEAARIAKQRVVIYETDGFLREFGLRQGQPVTASVVADLRAIEMSRAGTSAEVSDAENQVYQAVETLSYKMVDSDDEITSLIAQTNASGFSADEIDVLDVGPMDFSDATIPFSARIRFSGDQDEDRMYSGTVINARVTGHVRFNGAEWEVEDYSVNAELEDEWDDEPQSDD